MISYSVLANESVPSAKKKGWTQVVMAEKIGLDRSFIADVERGKRNISILNLALIAEGFQKSLSQFLSRI